MKRLHIGISYLMPNFFRRNFCYRGLKRGDTPFLHFFTCTTNNGIQEELRRPVMVLSIDTSALVRTYIDLTYSALFYVNWFICLLVRHDLVQRPYYISLFIL